MSWGRKQDRPLSGDEAKRLQAEGVAYRKGTRRRNRQKHTLIITPAEPRPRTP